MALMSHRPQRSSGWVMTEAPAVGSTLTVNRVAQAAAMYDEAKNSLRQTTLVSPIDGTVIEVTREVGERVRGNIHRTAILPARRRHPGRAMLGT